MANRTQGRGVDGTDCDQILDGRAIAVLSIMSHEESTLREADRIELEDLVSCCFGHESGDDRCTHAVRQLVNV